jgi:hypothetical protein
MDKDYLVLKRASVSRSSGEWSDDDFDVLCDGVVVGRIMKAAAVPVAMSWMWTLAYDYHEDRTHGSDETRSRRSPRFSSRTLFHSPFRAKRTGNCAWSMPDKDRCPIVGFEGRLNGGGLVREIKDEGIVFLRTHHRFRA